MTDIHVDDAQAPREDDNPFNSQEQLRLLTARQIYEETGTTVRAPDAPDLEEAPAIVPDDVLQRVDDVLRSMPEDEVEDPEAFRKAASIILEGGETALRKLLNKEPLDEQDGFGLEAIIRADGSRPSFLVQGGKPPATHPFMGEWSDEIAQLRDGLQPVAEAIGRIQPAGGSAGRFYGTGFLVSSDPPRVITNYHVIHQAQAAGVAMTQSGDRLTITGELEIDFLGESGTLESNRFRCTSVWLPPGYGLGFAGIDAAVVTLAPIGPESRLPRPIKLSRNPDFAAGSIASLCTIGFPAPPPRSSGTTGKVDWGWVVTTLFGGPSKFGLKRLAPGSFYKPLGYRGPTMDAGRRAFGHDATTFGGASGSPMLAWQDGSAAFGLHFRGINEDSNDAFAFARIETAFGGAGLMFRD
jgi:V8-like Glu-specific endopeptidase